jgi:guanylate kinase
MPAQIFVVSGASGSGKTTLVRALQANDPALRFSVSYTTRPSRPGEVHGQDYFFVSTAEFLKLIKEGLLVEHVRQFGYYYGTSRVWIDEALQGHQDILFDVEIHGAKALKKHFHQGNFVFILPPTSRILEKRLRDRGSLPEAELQQRLDRVRQEVQEASWYDYLVINDELPVAIRQLQAIFTTARCRTHVIWPAIKPHWT